MFGNFAGKFLDPIGEYLSGLQNGVSGAQLEVYLHGLHSCDSI